MRYMWLVGVGVVFALAGCRGTKPALEGSALTGEQADTVVRKISTAALKTRQVPLEKRPNRLLQSADGLTMVLWGDGPLQTYESATGKVVRECADALKIDGGPIEERVWLVGREHVVMSRGVTMRAVKATTCEVAWTYKLKPGESVSSLLGLERIEDESLHLWRTEPISPAGITWLRGQLPDVGALKGKLDEAKLTSEFNLDGGVMTIKGEAGDQRWTLKGSYRVYSQEFTEAVTRGRWIGPRGGVVLLHSYAPSKQKTSPIQAVETATGKTLWTAQLDRAAGSLRWSERSYTAADSASATTWIYLVAQEEHDETRTWVALRRDTGAVVATLDATAPKRDGRIMPYDARGRWVAFTRPVVGENGARTFVLEIAQAPR